MSKITENIYLGNYFNAMNYQWLMGKNISHVLNCAKEIPCSYTGKLIYKHVKGDDVPQFRMIPFLHDAADFIQDSLSKQGTVLVHCAAGISRSTTCLVAWFMKYRNMDLLSSLQYIRQRRSIICPNPGFIVQLKQFEQALKGSRENGMEKPASRTGRIAEEVNPISTQNLNLQNNADLVQTN